MNVSGVGQAIDIWALKTLLAAGQMQALAPVTTQVANNLAALDPNLGRTLDISV